MTNNERFSGSFESIAFNYIIGPGDPVGETLFLPIPESVIKSVESDCDFILMINLKASPLSSEYFWESSGISQTCQNGCRVEGEVSLGALGEDPMVKVVDETVPLPQKITQCLSVPPCKETFHKPVLELFAEYWGLQFLVEKIRFNSENGLAPTSQIADVLETITGQDFGTDADAWTEWLKEHEQR